jgi:predicted ATPase
MSATGRVTRVACFEHLQAAPLTPWIDVLQSILELTRDDPRERRTETVQAFFEGHLADLAEFGALLNPLLDLSLPQSEVVGSLDAQTRRAKLFELVGSILAESAADGGRVVVLEDYHWADESTQALVAYLAHRLTGDSILLLLTTRPTEARADLAGAEVTQVVLAELSRSESLAMVREALGVADLSNEVGEALYAKTKGNPLFLEEVVHSLQAPGVLERILSASSVTLAAELAALEIPDRVQGLLMSRIDRLPPDTREVLKAGSVVGRSFDEKVLSGIDDSLLRPASRTLTRSSDLDRAQRRRGALRCHSARSPVP